DLLRQTLFCRSIQPRAPLRYPPLRGVLFAGRVPGGHAAGPGSGEQNGGYLPDRGRAGRARRGELGRRLDGHPLVCANSPDRRAQNRHCGAPRGLAPPAQPARAVRRGRPGTGWPVFCGCRGSFALDQTLRL
ncbi:MAG: hypothetical protein AVDCRST_MAG56-3043, partial [uncultured Cytophagales bacterium]